MGTRSLTIVKESIDPSCEDIIVMYKQFDGYPEGMGVKLANFLEGYIIINGIPPNPNPKSANGMHDLAAQLVAEGSMTQEETDAVVEDYRNALDDGLHVAKSLVKELKPFAKNSKFYWCQEEPKNMGAWFAVRDYIQWTLETIKAKNNAISYIGRSPDATPATGYARRHNSEQQEIINKVFE